MITRITTLFIFAHIITANFMVQPEASKEISYAAVDSGIGWLLVATMLYTIKMIKDREYRTS